MARSITLSVLIFTVLPGVLIADDKPPADRATIERDLELKVELKVPATLEAGQGFELSLSIHNRSRDRQHEVPGYEPGRFWEFHDRHVRYTVERHTKEHGWQPMPPDLEERREKPVAGAQLPMQAILPGERLHIASMINPCYDFQRPGRYRVFAHFECKKDAVRVIDGVPGFSLSSEPVELTVARPLDLEVTVLDRLEAREPTKWSSLLKVELVNRSRKPRTLRLPAGPRFDNVTMDATPGNVLVESFAPRLGEENAHDIKERHSQTIELKPEERFVLIGPDSADGQITFYVDPDTRLPATIRVRVEYRHDDGSITLKSEWIKVRVVWANVASADRRSQTVGEP